MREFPQYMFKSTELTSYQGSQRFPVVIVLQTCEESSNRWAFLRCLGVMFYRTA